MRQSRETDPILPTTNMAATNGKSKDGKKKVLVVGAGAAGMSIAVASNMVVNKLGRNVVCSSFVATP
jgi:threonine dehydrogenase-like Zn-dependent dehydrogenase